jgi:rhomboid family GlyGly-CTERM serine protease
MIFGSKPHVATTLLILFIAFNLLSFNYSWNELFQYQRYAIANGQVWRLLTANIVHTGPMHVLANLLGLLVLWEISSAWLQQKEQLLILVVSMLLISLGIYFLFPGISWYLGLSGALHALWCAAALLGLKRERFLSITLLILLMTKIIWEITIGPMPMSYFFAGGPVLFQAHWLGVGSGLIIAISSHFLNSFR